MDTPNKAHRLGLSRLLTGWLLLITLLLSSRPLESVDLWWDLARGREAAGGAIRPSQNLLTLDNAFEANWLGGVPFYGVWSVAGIFGLAAVPLAMAFLLLRGIARAAAGNMAFAAVVIAPFAITAARSDLEPTGALFDLLGLTAVWLTLAKSGGRKWVVSTSCVIFAVWANLGPRPLWGVLLIAIWPELFPFRGAALLASLLGGMLTPRGPQAWVDSVILFAPTAFVPQAALEERWKSGLASGWDVSLAAAGVLWLVLIAELVRRRAIVSMINWGMVAVPMVAVLISRANVAPAALWMTFHWLMLTRKTTAPVVTVRRMWLRPAVALVTAFAIADACGMLAPGSQAMGWGLSQAIDPRLLEIADGIPGQVPAIAWASDSRSAGVAAWARTNTKLVDHPTRALLGGRSPVHAGIRRDLAWEHRAAYRLDDGAWGGWGRPFAKWNVKVLFVPAEATDLHRGLLETPWKLMKLDSPTVPYASAENSRFDRAVVDVMGQLGFVETGNWQPAIDVYDPHGWRVDASNLVGLGPISAPAIRQSQLFQSVKLPMAALRALGPVRTGGGTAAVRDQFLRCQEAMALEEYNAAGQVSLFRRLVLDVPGFPESRSDPWRRTTWSDWKETPEQWRTSRDLYRAGQIQDAINALPGDTSNEAYARGLMLLETGQIDLARASLGDAMKTTEPAVKIAAAYWLNQMEPAKKESTAIPRNTLRAAFADRGS